MDGGRKILELCIGILIVALFVFDSFDAVGNFFDILFNIIAFPGGVICILSAIYDFSRRNSIFSDFSYRRFSKLIFTGVLLMLISTFSMNIILKLIVTGMLIYIIYKI